MSNLTVSEMRRLKNFSRQELAEACGVHPNTIKNWEEKPSCIPVSKAFQIAETFNVSITDIIFEP